MTLNIDVDKFYQLVKKEISSFSTPKEAIVSQAQRLLESLPPDKELHGVLPGKDKPKIMSNELWHKKMRHDVLLKQKTFIAQLKAMESENKEWDNIMNEILNENHEIKLEILGFLWTKRQELAERKANELLKNKLIRKKLCAALKKAGDDIFDIAKILTPVLVGLTVSGTITIPLVPVLFASISLLISRIGIASICMEQSDSRKNGNNRVSP